MKQPQAGTINVRQYRPEDHATVVRLFREGMQSLAATFIRQLASNRKLQAAAAAATALVCSPFLHNPTSLLLALGACLSVIALALAAMYLRVLHSSIEQYVSMSIKSDLSDIAGVYDTARGGCFWVAELQGAEGSPPVVVGAVGLEPKSSAVGELRRMTVSSECQRRGVARKLSAALIAHARAAGFEQVMLTTSSMQPAARALYSAMGWQEVGGAGGGVLGGMVTFHKYELALQE